MPHPPFFRFFGGGGGEVILNIIEAPQKIT